MTANPIAEFTHSMQAVGLILDKHGVIDDGKIHPCRCAHDGANKKSGRYYLHSDGIANGAFGCYHESDNSLANEWRSTAPTPPMSDTERKAYSDRMARQQAEREAQTLQEQKDAQQACMELWGRGHEATSAHPYIERKGIRAYGVKELNGALLVPLYDGKDNLCNIQFIQADGTKRFKTGAKKKGAYFAFGSTDTKTVVICEGFATGASIAQATGHYVVVAFDAGNLLPVAERIKASLKDGWALIIAGDNDAFKPTNTGKDKATACAATVDACVVIPDFTGCEITNAPTDFNDLHALAGLEAVRAQIDGAQVLTTEQVAEVEAVAHAQANELETDAQTIERMAKLSLLEYARQSKDASDKLGITPSQLKQVVADFKKAQEPTTEKPPLIETVEAWDNPVNGAQVLDEVLAQLQAHVIADVETLHTASLWVCMTWLVDVATVLPVALISAPEKNCGKSTLLNAMAKMSKSALTTSNMSSAVLFRLIDKHAPSLFIDEVDTFLRDNIELGGILNAGHTKDGAYVMRCEGDNFEPMRFSVWGAKALSGISASNISGTLASRSIILNMRRKQAGESAQNIRHTPIDTFVNIKRKLARWADDNAGAFSQLHPVIDGLSNREQDNYEPLLAIAMLAGGDWVQHLERACNVSRQNNEESKSIGVELLEACKQIFETNHVDKIRSTTLLEYLLKDDEAIFATYNRGTPIKLRQVTKRLGDYGIKPKLMRFGYENPARGFELSQFNDAFKTYLEGEKVENIIFASDTPSLSVTPLQTNTSAGLSVTLRENCNVTKPTSVTPKAPIHAGCNTVTLRNPQGSQKNENVPLSNGFLKAREPMTQNSANGHDATFGEFVRNFAPETDSVENVSLTFGGDE